MTRCQDIRCNFCHSKIISIRLKKNCMSQSCHTRLFFGACLIQQNSSFLNCFGWLNFFFQFFMNLLVKIYIKSHDRYNKTLCTTDFFNSVFCLVSCSSINQVPYFILNKVVTDPIWHVCYSEKKNAFRSDLPICHKLWDIIFFFQPYTIMILDVSICLTINVDIWMFISCIIHYSK